MITLRARSGPLARAAVVAGAVLAAAAMLGGERYHGSALVAAVLLVVAGWIAWEDARSFTIPDEASLAVALLGGATRMAPLATWGLDPWPELGAIAVDAGLAGGAFLLLREGFYRWRGIDGIGFGDVKLAAAGGVLLGIGLFSWAVLAASLAGLAIAVVAATRGRRLAMLPFGALLAPACALIWLCA